MSHSDPGVNKFIHVKGAELKPKSDSHVSSSKEIASVHIRFQIMANRSQSVSETEGNASDDDNTVHGNSNLETTPISNNQQELNSEVDVTNQGEVNIFSLDTASSNEEILIRPVETLSLISVNLNGHSGNQTPWDDMTPSSTSSKHEFTLQTQSFVKGESIEGTDSKMSTTLQVLHPKINSSMTLGGRRCRICMSCGSERLISPCHCKGSLGVMHVSCLERWLSVSGRGSCELCGYSFPVVMTQRYSIYRALVIWLRFSRNRTTFMTDCLFFWTLTVLTTSLVACCVLGSKYFSEHGNTVGMPRVLAEGMTDILLSVVVCGYAITTFVLWRDHANLWRRWRLATMDVRLVVKDLKHNSEDSDTSKSNIHSKS